MWILLPVAALLYFSLSSSKGRQAVSISASFIKVAIDSIIPKEKISVKHINSTAVIQIKDVTLNTKVISKYYDITCVDTSTSFHDTNDNVKHQQSISTNLKSVIPITYFRHGVNVCSIPFRPKDLGYETLYIYIKNVNEELYSVYKFSKDMYINLLDLNEIYESDKLKSIHVPVLAEAYD